MLQAGVIGAPIGWKQTPHRNHDAVSPPSAFKTMASPPSTGCRSGICRILDTSGHSIDESVSGI